MPFFSCSSKAGNSIEISWNLCFVSLAKVLYFCDWASAVLLQPYTIDISPNNTNFAREPSQETIQPKHHQVHSKALLTGGRNSVNNNSESGVKFPPDVTRLLANEDANK